MYDIVPSIILGNPRLVSVIVVPSEPAAFFIERRFRIAVPAVMSATTGISFVDDILLVLKEAADATITFGNSGNNNSRYSNRSIN